MSIYNDKDGFWDLGEFRKTEKQNVKYTQAIHQKPNQSSPSTSAVEISVTDTDKTVPSYADSVLTKSTDGTITKFIPPRSDAVFAKKHVLLEYSPTNPFIKQIRILSDKPNDSLFVEDNLFIRERRALLDRRVSESPFVPFYSYSPRYSQMTKPQLKWYLWWREKARQGEFLKTDQSYIMLYTYELAATGEGEDKQKALEAMCNILTQYSNQELPLVFKMTIRDMLCDFCIMHRLSPPTDKLSIAEHQIIFNSFLPEFFIDFSKSNNESVIASLSLYDYRRSKFCDEQNARVFKEGIYGALRAVINNEEAFDAIMSFTKGVYGCITTERHPLPRMVNIVNRNIRIEISYFELSGIRGVITDIVRYSENKVREHLGIKNKINVLSVNPVAKGVIDAFFAENLPPRAAIDRRRKEHRNEDSQMHEYDKLYDVPKTEISPERAILIEQESWNTTRILMEAFSDGVDETESIVAPEVTSVAPIIESEKEIVPISTNTSNDSVGGDTDTLTQIRDIVGDKANFIPLCLDGDRAKQRAFALSLSLTVDELADRINEAALEFVGDIILENDGTAYIIIEDYRYLFDKN